MASSLLESARVVAPGPITGKESPRLLLDNAFPAFVGRQVRTAAELMDRCAREGHAVFSTPVRGARRRYSDGSCICRYSALRLPNNTR